MDRAPSRRALLAALSAGGLAGLSGCQSLTPSPDTEVPPSPGDATSPTSGTGPAGGDAPLPDAVGLETLAAGLQAPVDVAVAPDAGRRYVADQPGRIYLHDDEGLREEPLLDLGDRVTAGGERGLLGIALHPEFAANRRLFVRYSSPPRPGTPDDYSHTFVLSEFTATDDGADVDAGSERVVLEIPEPQGNHNAGSIAFGPDGLLYVGVGDGGAGGDRGEGHVDDWYDDTAGGNGQNTTENRLGGILRIDVDGGASETPRDGGGGAADGPDDRPYAVPEDNPLVDADEHRDAYYAWGLRNPWRFSFDGEAFYVADVGQNRYEEVNLVERGGNYGWNVKEGTHCYGADDCPDRTPEDVRGGEPLLDPVIEYPNESPTADEVNGRSVIGGHVYRGSALPGLEGRYVFGDLAARGRLFVSTPPENGTDGLWPTEVVPVVDDHAGKIGRILSFGREPDGELYVLGIGDDGGGLHRVVPAA
jgi:glucose/arabinose dehydrogenase